jgi:hypothetical protein
MIYVKYFNKVFKQQKSNLEQLQEAHFDYFDMKIKIRETFENIRKIETESFSKFELSRDLEKILLDLNEPVQRLMFLLRNDDKYLLHLIETLEESKENYDSIVELVCHQLYENLLIQNPDHEELLILCYKLIIKEVNNMNSARATSFLDDNCTFIGKLLKSYTKRQDMKTFITMILGEIIMNIENVSEINLDLEVSRITSYLKDKKNSFSINKSYTEEFTKTLIFGENYSTRPRRCTVKGREVVDTSGNICNSMAENNTIRDKMKTDEVMNGYFEETIQPKSQEEMKETTQCELNELLENEKDKNMKDFCKSI